MPALAQVVVYSLRFRLDNCLAARSGAEEIHVIGRIAESRVRGSELAVLASQNGDSLTWHFEQH